METQLGYQLVSKLGDTDSGESYLAQARTSGAHAVVRFFDAGPWREPAAQAEFFDRAQLLQGVDHPHLARQYEAGRLPDGRPFVVSEYLDGEDLAGCLVKRGPLTPDQVALLVLPLCSALEALRSRGIVVQTLPAAQVFLVGGLSRYAPKLVGPGLGERSDVGGPGGDVRALGTLMVAALGGEAAGWVAPIVDRCLAEDPVDRFRSPAEIARALEDAQPRTQVLTTHEAGGPPLLLVEERDREKPGDVLGAYRLERLLGEGAMGRVFLARHATLGRSAAVKVLRAEHARNANLIQRFFHEARAVNRINHEHIVEILDFVQETTPQGLHRVYCVMEMLEGQSLTEALAQQPLAVSRAVEISRQVCRALQAAHDVGVIHRDVKPDNLFLMRRGGQADFVKVLDFGVAKLVTPLGDLPLTSTLEGTIVGTPAYMAPEQAAGLGADGRTDLYAVGTVLYEMLAGRPPFGGLAFGQLVAQVITAAPPALPARTRAGQPIPRALSAVVMRCLAKDPVDRYRDLRTLDAVLGEAGRQPNGRGGAGTVGRWALGVAAALALLAAGSTALRPTPARDANLASASGAGDGAESSALPPPDGAMGARTVRLRAVSAPSGATVLRRDTGERLGSTPMLVRVPASDVPLVLRFEAEGHLPAERTVEPRQDIAVELALVPQSRRRGANTGPGNTPTPPRRSRHPDPFKL